MQELVWMLCFLGPFFCQNTSLHIYSITYHVISWFMISRVIVVGSSGTIGRAICSIYPANGFTNILPLTRRPLASGHLSFDLTRDSILDAVPDISSSDAIVLAAYSSESVIFRTL